MKKLFILCMLLLPAFTFAGCSKDENEPQTENSNDSGSNEDNNNQEPETPGNGKTLIAYFSRWGNTNYPDNVDASTGASIIINNGERVGTTDSPIYSIRYKRRHSSYPYIFSLSNGF